MFSNENIHFKNLMVFKMFENFLEKLEKMPRHYLYLFSVYIAFLIINIIYFYLPSIGYGLYEDLYLIGFALFSFIPLVVFLLELEGKIGEDHYRYVRDVNYLLIIFFLLITTIFIVPVLVI